MPKMTLPRYREMTENAAIYRQSVQEILADPNPETLPKILKVLYATTGLAGEAGEVCNKVKKILRDNKGVIDEEVKHRVLGELGGVAWYLDALSYEFGLTLEEVLAYNYDQIVSRKERGKLQGDGDDR